MEALSLEKIVEGLQTEKSRLSERRSSLQSELSAVDVELERIASGLTALTGKAASTRTKSGKRSPNKETVREAVRRCLQEQEVLNVDALKEEVGKRVKAEGYSCVGMALRLREVLEEPSFTSSPSGYSLSSSEANELSSDGQSDAWQG